MTISATTRGLRPGVCTSTTRPGSPFDGQLIYETDTNLMSVWNGSAWKTLSYSDYTSGSVLQVASTTKTDPFTSTSTSYTDVTGLSVTITPRSTSNRILVMMTGQMNGTSGAANCQYRLMRDSTAIGVGDASGTRTPASGQAYVPDNNGVVTSSALVLDSPASTSLLTYKVQVKLNTSSTLYVNRAPSDSDLAAVARYATTITVMEIAG